MKNRILFVLAVSGALMIPAVPLLAHHSFAAEYDSNKPVTLTGTVTKMEWQNPHARFYVDVKDEAGKVTNWEFELGSPNGLMRRVGRAIRSKKATKSRSTATWPRTVLIWQTRARWRWPMDAKYSPARLTTAAPANKYFARAQGRLRHEAWDACARRKCAFYRRCRGAAYAAFGGWKSGLRRQGRVGSHLGAGLGESEVRGKSR